MNIKRRALLTAATGSMVYGLWPIRGASADIEGITPAGKETLITTSELATFDERMTGDILKKGDTGYEMVRHNWNGSFDKKPALIARCAGTEDVASAIRFARENDLLVAIRAGGHSYSGQSSVDDGLMIDLQPMKTLEIDPAKKIARVGAGVFLGEFDRATAKYGLATTAGTVPHTGIAGLTLGGGVGRLMRLYGMTIDNVLSVEMVTVDGKVVRASESENPDLFWGVRGGAGNFGVVTAFEYRLHDMGKTVQTFSYRFAAEQAVQAMKFHFEYANNAPDNIHTSASLSSDVNGVVTANISGTHIGPASETESLIGRIAKFGTPIAQRVQTVNYVDVQQGGPNPSPHGRGYYSGGGFTGIEPKMVEPAFERFKEDPLGGMVINFFSMGGAAGRVPNEATAYAHRDALFSVSTSSSWDDPRGKGKEIGDRAMAWCRASWAKLRPFSDGGFYANLTSDVSEKAVRENFRGNYDRIVALKTKYDPTNFFRMNANILPKQA